MLNNKCNNIAALYMNGDYLKKNPTWHTEDSAWKAQQIHKILLKNHIIDPLNICEVGCGAGEILRELSAIYPNASFVGYELSRDAFELCQIKETDNVKYLLKNIAEEQQHAELLLCMDVFEHVDDYIGFCKELKSKSTYKIFHIPLDISVFSVLENTLLTARNKLGHLHYFTRGTALATLEYCGYEIIDCYYTAPFYDLVGKSFKTKIGNFLRKGLSLISKELTSRVIGGCSLIVLAK